MRHSGSGDGSKRPRMSKKKKKRIPKGLLIVFCTH